MKEGTLKPDYIHLKKKKGWNLDWAFKGQSFPCWLEARMRLWAVLIYLTSNSCEQGNRNRNKVSSKYFLWCAGKQNSSWPSQISFETDLTWLLCFCISRIKYYVLVGSSCWREKGVPGSCRFGRESGEALWMWGGLETPGDPAYHCSVPHCRSHPPERQEEGGNALVPWKVGPQCPLCLTTWRGKV